MKTRKFVDVYVKIWYFKYIQKRNTRKKERDYMLDEKICKLRQKLNESIMKGQDYNVTYKLSVELDKLIAQYYKKKLRGINKKIKIQKRR